MLQEFALPIYAILFEPVDEITSYRLGEMILEAVKKWEKRIVVDNVEVIARPDSNEYRVSLEYRIVNDSREENILTFTNVLRAS